MQEVASEVVATT